MNIDTNVSVILGRIVRDAEVKEKNGKKYCQFSVAVNTYAKDKPVGNFFNLAIFDKYAETIGPYLKKGQQVIVEGYLTQKNIEIGESKISRWIDIYDGVKFLKSLDKVSDDELKAAIFANMDLADIVVVLLSKNVKSMRKFIKWQIEYAVNTKKPLISMNCNRLRILDYDVTPTSLTNKRI